MRTNKINLKQSNKNKSLVNGRVLGRLSYIYLIYSTVDFNFINTVNENNTKVGIPL